MPGSEHALRRLSAPVAVGVMCCRVFTVAQQLCFERPVARHPPYSRCIPSRKQCAGLFAAMLCWAEWPLFLPVLQADQP